MNEGAIVLIALVLFLILTFIFKRKYQKPGDLGVDPRTGQYSARRMGYELKERERAGLPLPTIRPGSMLMSAVIIALIAVITYPYANADYSIFISLGFGLMSITILIMGLLMWLGVSIRTKALRSVLFSMLIASVCIALYGFSFPPGEPVTPKNIFNAIIRIL